MNNENSEEKRIEQHKKKYDNDDDQKWKENENYFNDGDVIFC